MVRPSSSSRPVLWIAACVATCGLALAAPPVNDAYANKTTLSGALPLAATGTNVEATLEAGEPALYDGERSVWWTWTAPASGPVEVNTLGSHTADGSPLDTVLAVHTGSALSALSRVAENDEAGSGWTSRLYFQAVAGSSYHIQVAGSLGAVGAISLALKPGPPVPANDAFASAATLPVGGVATGTTDGATLEANEPYPPGVDPFSYFASGWWKWTAPASGWQDLAVQANSSLVASVWTGTAVNALTAVHAGAIDTAGQTSTLHVHFQATAGVTYRLAIGSLFQPSGSPVALQVSPLPVPPLRNESLTLSATAVNVTNAGATVTAVFRLVSATAVTSGHLRLARDAVPFGAVSFTDANRTSGTALDGTYTVPFTIPRYSRTGNYRITRINLYEVGQTPQPEAEIGELATVPFAGGAIRSLTVANTGSQDTAAPILQSVTVSPGSVDVTSAAQTLTVTLQLTDALSGVRDATVELLRAQDGTLVDAVPVSSANRISGNAQNGTYRVFLTVPTSARGPHRLAVDRLVDLVGNGAPRLRSDAAGWPGPFTGTVAVTASEAQTLSTFTVPATAVDVTSAPGSAVANFSVTSTTGQFDFATLRFLREGGGAYFETFVLPGDRISGTATAGSYRKTVAVPRYLPPGPYTAIVSIVDSNDRTSRYGLNGAPFPAGASITLNVANTGVADTADPGIASFAASPARLAPESTAPVTADLHLTDDGSGIDSAIIYLAPITGGDIVYLGNATQLSGTVRDGQWRLVTPLPSGLPEGVYAYEISVTDSAGRFSFIHTDPEIPGQSLTVAPPLPPFQEWAAVTGLPPSQSGPDDDADADGVKNFLEFAFGTDPLAGGNAHATLSSPGLASPLSWPDGDPRPLRLVFWIPADPQALGLTFTARFGPDPALGQSSVAGTLSIDANVTLQTPTGPRHPCTVVDPAGATPLRRFGRVTVTQTP